MKIKNISVFMLIFFISGLNIIKAQSLEVIITDIRSSNGQIVIGVFADEESFKKDQPLERKKFNKKI